MALVSHRNSLQKARGNIVIADQVGQTPELPATEAAICYIRLVTQDISSKEVVDELAVLACQNRMTFGGNAIFMCIIKDALDAECMHITACSALVLLYVIADVHERHKKLGVERMLASNRDSTYHE